MTDKIIDYLLFCGLGLYLLNSLMFLYLFLRTLNTKDGVGLVFLKILTFAVFLGSLIIASLRIGYLYFNLDSDLSRAIATINPIILLGVGLYLNYLFNHKVSNFTRKDKKI